MRVDNTAAVHYITIRYGAIPTLEHLVGRLEAAERVCGCWALAVHLAGKSNNAADAGSRDYACAGRWAADQFRDATLRSNLLSDIQPRCGVLFTLDVFSDRLGVNAQAPKWRCPELTAFEADLSGNSVWAFPHRDLLKATLNHLIVARKANPSLEAVILAAEDPAVNCLVTATQEKCAACQTSCALVLESDTHRNLRARSLATAAGLASHIAELYPQARRRLHPIWTDLNAVGVYAAWAHSPSADPPVTLSGLSRKTSVG